MAQNRLLQSIRTIFFVLSWIIIGYLVIKNISPLRHLLTVKDPAALCISFFLLFPSYWAMYWARTILSRSLNLHLSEKRQFYIFTHNMITRYIPGGIWNQLDAVLLLKDEKGGSIKQGSKLVFLEMYWRVMFGYLFFGWIIFSNFQFSIFNFQNPILIFIESIVVIFLVTYLISKKKPALFLYSWTAFFKEGIANFLFYIFNGISLTFLFTAFTSTQLTGRLVWYITSATSISWIGGFLFLPAPSGLGVREGLMALFMNKLGGFLILGFSLTLLQRLMMTVRDAMAFGLALLVIKTRTRS